MGDGRGPKLATLELTAVEREELRGLARRPKTAQALALRARIVLACADGLSNSEASRKLGVSLPRVRRNSAVLEVLRGGTYWSACETSTAGTGPGRPATPRSGRRWTAHPRRQQYADRPASTGGCPEAGGGAPHRTARRPTRRARPPPLRRRHPSRAGRPDRLHRALTTGRAHERGAGHLPFKPA
ncbi:helix-turn-helix domain-containing protein [Dactylosporangium sp. NPDC000521]|uniref:helix-turn-helix domain-containing protein n=1 Tax=Dactylosporangium sp. NPDC000521 TaxID=3363975 RepID=UPI003688160A